MMYATVTLEFVYASFESRHDQRDAELMVARGWRHAHKLISMELVSLHGAERTLDELGQGEEEHRGARCVTLTAELGPLHPEELSDTVTRILDYMTVWEDEYELTPRHSGYRLIGRSRESRFDGE